MKPYNISLALLYFRSLRGNTQVNLAQKSGVTQDYISRIEKDQKKPSLETLEKLLGALDVTFSEFFTTAEILAQFKADRTAVKQLASADAQAEIADKIQQLEKQLATITGIKHALGKDHPSGKE